jgi:hypothetical protein
LPLYGAVLHDLLQDLRNLRRNLPGLRYRMWSGEGRQNADELRRGMPPLCRIMQSSHAIQHGSARLVFLPGLDECRRPRRYLTPLDPVRSLPNREELSLMPSDGVIRHVDVGGAGVVGQGDG